jgi:hypothetical protein
MTARESNAGRRIRKRSHSCWRETRGSDPALATLPDFRGYEDGTTEVLLLKKHGLQKPGEGGITFESLDRP